MTTIEEQRTTVISRFITSIALPWLGAILLAGTMSGENPHMAGRLEELLPLLARDGHVIVLHPRSAADGTRRGRS